MTVDLITFNDGTVWPAPALQIANDLERRDFTLWVKGGLLFVLPPDGTILSHADRLAIQQWREDLIRILRYCGLERG